VRLEDLLAWQDARAFAGMVYRVTAAGSIARDFALRDQFRRAAVSVMCNIAEGFGRGGPAEFARFLDIARGSAAECQAIILLAQDLSLLDGTQSADLLSRLSATQRKMAGLSKYQQRRKSARAPSSPLSPLPSPKH
jgi:four helix bundle protein